MNKHSIDPTKIQTVSDIVSDYRFSDYATGATRTPNQAATQFETDYPALKSQRSVFLIIWNAARGITRIGQR